MAISNLVNKASESFKRAERELAWDNYQGAADNFKIAAHYYSILAKVAPHHMGNVDMVKVALTRMEWALNGTK